MKLIVGLGNPDKEYKGTYHNLGFSAIDVLCDELGVYVNKDSCRALIGSAYVGKEKVIFAKPQTYMNLSGESVFELCSYYKISPQDVIVIYDDFDLKKGDVRIRKNGSAGTHNGMRNIVKILGNGEFARIRIGFKPKTPTMIPLLDMVLSGIKPEDKPLFDKMTTLASDACVDFAKGVTIQQVMQKYNTNAE